MPPSLGEPNVSCPQVRTYVCLLMVLLAGAAGGCGRAREGGAGAVEGTRQGLVTPAGAITGTGDDLRTGWYPDQPKLHPGVVGGPTFGRLWKTTLPLTAEEQVFAQPLVLGTTVFVVTEANNIYALDGETGVIKASRALGGAWSPKDIACSDLTPTIGITGTPIIHVATRTAYFFSKRYLDGTPSPDPAKTGWFAHAVDVDTLAERPGFPVRIQGTADNDPTSAFNAFYQLQRPALLLMDGVVYAGFGGHCDAGDYRGWVVGLTLDGKIRGMFSTELGEETGGGIWQSGGGLVSDGPGRIYFVTGNSFYEAKDGSAPQAAPDGHLGQSAVRLQVQPDGTLRAADFFAPYNRETLDLADTDFGSGAPVGLPADAFATPEYPRLVLAGGKAGVLYLLDGDHLGGYRQGSGGADAVISMVNAAGPMYSRPALYPPGKYVYVLSSVSPLQVYRYGLGGNGKPLLSEVGRSAAIFGYTSGSPIVTSDGAQPGTALVWVNYTSGTYGDGRLRAYEAVPDAAGTLPLRFEDAYGTQAKFSVPGVGNGRIYVGTADGAVLGYGAPIQSALSGARVEFGTLVVGSSLTKEVVLTAAQDLTVTAVSVAGADYAFAPPAPALPLALKAGETLKASVVFTPTVPAIRAGTVDVVSSAGSASVVLEGRGEEANALLTAAPKTISFEGLARGRTRTKNVVLSNAGAQPLTFQSLTAPAAPFAASNLPAVGATLAPGAQVTVTLTFAPTAVGNYSGSLVVGSSGGEVTVFLAGAGGEPPALAITPPNLDFGTVLVGESVTRSFNVTNTGGADLIINKSKAPGQGSFVARSPLDEGTVIAPGGTRSLMIVFVPKSAGPLADQWQITGDDDSGLHVVAFTGVGQVPAAVDAGPAPDAAPVPGTPVDLVDASPPSGTGAIDADIDADLEAGAADASDPSSGGTGGEVDGGAQGEGDAAVEEPVSGVPSVDAAAAGDAATSDAGAAADAAENFAAKDGGCAYASGRMDRAPGGAWWLFLGLLLAWRRGRRVREDRSPARPAIRSRSVS